MEKGFYILSKEREPRFLGAAIKTAVARFRRIELKPGEWVDYYYGLDVDGMPAYANLDYSEKLIDMDLGAWA
jgi:hypothetical protein